MECTTSANDKSNEVQHFQFCFKNHVACKKSVLVQILPMPWGRMSLSSAPQLAPTELEEVHHTPAHDVLMSRVTAVI